MKNCQMMLHKYSEIKKFTMEVNKATYLTVSVFLSSFLENNKKIEPIAGNNIKDERIGKSIN
jgi:hypothetical protein